LKPEAEAVLQQPAPALVPVSSKSVSAKTAVCARVVALQVQRAAVVTTLQRAAVVPPPARATPARLRMLVRVVVATELARRGFRAVAPAAAMLCHSRRLPGFSSSTTVASRQTAWRCG
jgi:hypothetical protein